MKIRNEHVGDEIQDVNSHSHMNSISELVSQVAFLTDKVDTLKNVVYKSFNNIIIIKNNIKAFSFV